MLDAESPDALHSAYKQVLNVTRFSAERERQAVLSSLVFVTAPQVKKWIDNACGNLRTLRSAFEIEAQKHYKNLCARLKTSPADTQKSSEELTLSKIIPVRGEHFVCPLQTDWLVEKLGESALEEIRLRGYSSYEALNFADGQRSILDIANAVSAEFGPVRLEDVFAFFRLLERAGLVELERK
jgi:hypothetical protein